jgi:hypothetical protein
LFEQDHADRSREGILIREGSDGPSALLDLALRRSTGVVIEFRSMLRCPTSDAERLDTVHMRPTRPTRACGVD